MTHVARALSRAHDAGIVHRDLKPDNVFLVRNEDEEVAKVLDFGIAKAQTHALAGDSGTRTGTVMGTAYYMSPEQISGQKSVDLRTDLWALGVMTYECLSGTRPFDAETIGGLTLKICIEPMPIPSQHASVPPGFDQWFARCVHRDPAQRFASAREAAEALRLVCTGVSGDMMVSSDGAARAVPAPVTGSAIASTAAPVSHSTVRGHVAHQSPSPWPWLALAGVIVVGALTGGALWWRSRGEHASAEPPPSSANGVPAPPAPSPVASPEIVPAAAPLPNAEIAPSAKAAPSAPSTSAPAASVAAPPETKKALVPVKPAHPAATIATAARPAATVLVKPKPPVVRDVIDDRH
jgi:serine/threonine-protein kinase